MRTLIHLIVKDIKLFLADKSAALITIAVPIGIAGFMTFVTGSSTSGGDPKPVEIVVADQDQSAMSKNIMNRLRHERGLVIHEKSAAEAEEMAKNGKTAYAIVIPAGFSQAATLAAANQAPKPNIKAMVDPAQNLAVLAARGFVLGNVANGFMDTMQPDQAAKPDDDHLPFKIQETKEQATKTDDDAAATRAHVFAGMALQGVLFYAINLGMAVLRDRKQGIWKRLRAAPVTIQTLVLGKVGSGFVIACITIAAIFAFGMGVMGVRVQGSWPAFIMMIFGTAIMASSFGLLIASLGKTEEQSRGLSIFVVLSLSMLGGAWFPTFLMPAFLQKATLLIPSRWAVDGLDGVLWRGWGLMETLPIFGVTIAFAVVFYAIAAARLVAIEKQT